MYHAEVLAKLPVAQHIYFGQLLPFPPMPDDATSQEESLLPTDEHGHVHIRGEMYGDCCGCVPFPLFCHFALADIV